MYHAHVMHACPPTMLACRALTCLSGLEVVDNMLDISRNNLFPTAEEVASLNLHFSLPAPLQASQTPREQGREKEEVDSSHTLQRPKAPCARSHVSKRRVWTALDTTNPDFDLSIRRRGLGKDYIQSNIVGGVCFLRCVVVTFVVFIVV